jgi:prolyl oligopeptidase
MRLLATIAVLVAGCANVPVTMNTDAPIPDDPYLWLEDVHGEQALAWVRQRNTVARQRLEAFPDFGAMRERIRGVLDSRDRIAQVTRRGDWLFNFWQDAEHPRGLWRRTTLDEYRKAEIAWDVLLDVDALGRAESTNWVWAGASCLGPAYRHCLVSLSRGGADATVVREFDLATRRFVPGGFSLPEAKSQTAWLDADTLLVGTDFGAGSLTTSGYPRVVKSWRRGQPLAQAATIFEAQADDVSAWFEVDLTPGFARTVVGRSIDFYNARQWLWHEARLLPIDKPDDAQLHFWRDRVLLQLRSDWTAAGRHYAKGSLLAADAAAYLAGGRDFAVLFEPTAERSLAGFITTGRQVVMNLLDNVASRLEEWRPDGARRSVRAPFPGTISIAGLHDPLVGDDDPLAEAYWLGYSDFLTPDSLMLAHTGADAHERVKSRPVFFDATGMRVEQQFATSKDGTRVPYFVVWPPGATADGANPTLLYGYGGFESPLVPWYSGSFGTAWYQRGGVLVVANIRGGGEFGPAWHQAATLSRKQASYDDFAAVAEDLIARRITSARHLGIEGGSNGGLLVGAVMLQRPELFRAVVCQVPLLDMRRYHQLLAGASWMAEYGDPDRPDQWAWISRYSPYQNVKAGMKLPAVLFTTSTRDDRVHPGHARKMAARMIEQGHDVTYYENIEGGHGGAADNAQRADMMALEFSFLWQRLAR